MKACFNKECDGYETQDSDESYCPVCGWILTHPPIPKYKFRQKEKKTYLGEYKRGYEKGYDRGKSVVFWRAIFAVIVIIALVGAGFLFVDTTPPDPDPPPIDLVRDTFGFRVRDALTDTPVRNVTCDVFAIDGTYYGSGEYEDDIMQICDYPGYYELPGYWNRYIEARLIIKAPGYYTVERVMQEWLPNCEACSAGLIVYPTLMYKKAVNVTMITEIQLSPDHFPHLDIMMTCPVKTSVGGEVDSWYDLGVWRLYYRNVLVIKTGINDTVYFEADSTYTYLGQKYYIIDIDQFSNDEMICDDGIMTKAINFAWWGSCNVILMFFDEISHKNIELQMFHNPLCKLEVEIVG